MIINPLITQIVIAVLSFAAVSIGVYYGWDMLKQWLHKQEKRYDKVLNDQLLLEMPPRVAMMLTALIILALGIIFGLLLESPTFFIIGCALGLAIPHLVINHLEEKRLKKLDEQIIDGITTVASAVRAGLTLVQGFQLLVQNSVGPIKQETAQMMKEYDLGIDLQQAMHNTANRIGSKYYRLLFTAIQAHRERGGDMGQSLDRIAESIREIQRLEGKLDAITAQGRTQARFMGIMPFVIIAILWVIDSSSTERLITEPIGRLILLTALVLIATGFIWIRRIMNVDI